MLDVKEALLACAGYLRDNPREMLLALRNFPRLRVGIPVAALRWLAAEFETEGGPRDITIQPKPPGLAITATLEQMGTLLRASACGTVESVRISAQQMRIVVRLADVQIRLLQDHVTTPLGALIKSGALDVTRIANLVAHMPKRPVALVEAVDDRLVLDLRGFLDWRETPS